MPPSPPRLDTVAGDATGLPIPAHPDALRAAGAPFLTRAFHAFGTLAADNRVTAIADWRPCPGGSTGAKRLMTLDYARDEPGLPRELFVKFSRDFTDERRDRQRFEMASEARLAPVSRRPGFPIAVPMACFADFHAASGTGLVVTAQVRFGEDGVEPHRRKCLDHLTMADPLPYYRAIVAALARLAAADHAGRLAADLDARFPFDPLTGSADPIAFDAAGLAARLAHGRALGRAAPRLLPAVVLEPGFARRLADDAAFVLANEARLRAALVADRSLIALCHWNAHVDNAWFERDAVGRLRCGLIDWGRAGRMTLGSALWGALSAAHHAIWRDHLDTLLAVFVAEYAAAGGPAVPVARLKRHLLLHIAVMGVARCLDLAEVVLFRLPEAVDATGPLDPMFERSDAARNSLHVYTVLLELWQREDIGGLVRAAATG